MIFGVRYPGVLRGLARLLNDTVVDGELVALDEACRPSFNMPAVGREIEYRGSATTTENVAKVEAFGRAWLFIESSRVTPVRRGERAAFEEMTFSACLTWPANTALYPKSVR